MPHSNLSNLTTATARDPLTHADCFTSVDAIWGIYKEHTYLESKQEHIPRGRAAALELVVRASGNIRIAQRGWQRGRVGGVQVARFVPTWRERIGPTPGGTQVGGEGWGVDPALRSTCVQVHCFCCFNSDSASGASPNHSVILRQNSRW